MNARIAVAEDAERLLDLMEDFNRIESIPFARETMRQALLPLLAVDNHVGRVSSPTPTMLRSVMRS